MSPITPSPRSSCRSPSRRRIASTTRRSTSILSRDRALTVRRTPKDGEPFDPTELKETCEDRDVPPGKVAFHLADIVAERYLDLIDDLNEEIDEVEDGLDRSLAMARRASADLRPPPRHPAHPSDALTDARRGPSSRGRQGRGRGAAGCWTRTRSRCSATSTTSSSARTTRSSSHAISSPASATSTSRRSRRARTRSCSA